MRLAVVLPYWFDRPALEALDIARAAERNGFDELWAGEMMTFDAFALSGAIARQTRRMSLVVGPLAIGVRDPAALALGIASVSALGGRTAHLALGASTPVVVSEWHGRPWTDNVERMRETVAALRQILGGERSAFAGRQVHTTGFRLRSGPQSSQLIVAAFGPHMIRLAAAVADRVVVNLVTPAQVARVRTALHAAASAAGRSAVPLVAWVPVALDPDDAVRAQLARQLVAYLAPPGYGEMFTGAGFGDLVIRARAGTHPRELMGAIPRELLESVCAMGDIGAVRQQLDAYRAAGADMIGLVPATASDPGGRRTLRALAGPS